MGGKRLLISLAFLAWAGVATIAFAQWAAPEPSPTIGQSPQDIPGYPSQPGYPQQAPPMYGQPPGQAPQGYPPQGMYPPQGQPGQQPPPQGAPQAPAQGQQPGTYAFRPNLTNPEYGECLQMEKAWKDLWNQYYQQYENYRRWGYSDPTQAAIWQHNLTQLRQQLDQAWQNFTGRCIYFPQRPR
jgi:hypothetical protein